MKHLLIICMFCLGAAACKKVEHGKLQEKTFEELLYNQWNLESYQLTKINSNGEKYFDEKVEVNYLHYYIQLFPNKSFFKLENLSYSSGFWKVLNDQTLEITINNSTEVYTVMEVGKDVSSKRYLILKIDRQVGFEKHIYQYKYFMP